MFKFEVEVPDLALSLEDEAEALLAAAEVLAVRFKTNIVLGVDWQGKPLPQPKDGKNPPLQRSDELLRSIEAKGTKSTKRGAYAIAGPTGKRNLRLAAILSAEGKESDRSAYKVFLFRGADVDLMVKRYEERVKVALEERKNVPGRGVTGPASED